MSVRINTQLPAREIVVCTIEEHNKTSALLKERDLLGKKWQLVIVDPNEIERAAKSFQEIVDDKRVTQVFMGSTIDHELYMAIRDFCTNNGVEFLIVDVEKETVE